MEGNHQIISRIKSSSQSAALATAFDDSKDRRLIFWQEWQAYQDYLYLCCFKWMKLNSIDAEDILSQVMLKAWNEWQKSEGKIKNPKAWFTRILYNFCIDVHRKNKREIQNFNQFEETKFKNCPEFFAQIEILESSGIEQERWLYLHHQIESLPTKLRDPFVLRYCQEKTYQDIAKHLSCSEESVRKCVRKARLILQKHLIKYIAGEDDTPLDSSSPSLKLVIPLTEKLQSESDWESLIPTKSQGEDISYQVTVLCQESLPHHWYSSINPLGWR